MMRTDDPIADAERYAAEQDRRLDKLPVCECCGKAIQQFTTMTSGFVENVRQNFG